MFLIFLDKVSQIFKINEEIPCLTLITQPTSEYVGLRFKKKLQVRLFSFSLFHFPPKKVNKSKLKRDHSLDKQRVRNCWNELVEYLRWDHRRPERAYHVSNPECGRDVLGVKQLLGFLLNCLKFRSWRGRVVDSEGGVKSNWESSCNFVEEVP